MNIVKPFDDNYLKYDIKNNRYVLTTEYVRDEFGNPYNDDKILETRIKKNTRVIYGYIYKVGNAKNRELVNFLLHQTTEGRKFIFDVLSSQMEADLETGINTLVNVPKINIKNGQVLDQQAMANAYISENTLNILDQSSATLGLNILYQGVYPPLIWAQFRSYLK